MIFLRDPRSGPGVLGKGKWWKALNYNQGFMQHINAHKFLRFSLNLKTQSTIRNVILPYYPFIFIANTNTKSKLEEKTKTNKHDSL